MKKNKREPSLQVHHELNSWEISDFWIKFAENFWFRHFMQIGNFLNLIRTFLQNSRIKFIVLSNLLLLI